MTLAIALAGVGQAAVTYVNLHASPIIIPATFEGVYLDLSTGTPSGSSSSGAGTVDPSGSPAEWTVSYSEPMDWDINIFFGGAGIVHNTTLQPYREDASDNLSAIHSVGEGAVIDGTPIDPEPASGVSAPMTNADNFGGFGGFGGSATGVGLDGLALDTHMGAAADQFTSGDKSFIAFVLNSGTASEQYGWMEVTLYDDGTDGLIHRWAYSDDPIVVGVPEPATALLGLLGVFGLLVRRRR